MPDEKLKVKSTDVVILRVRHGMAQSFDETALVADTLAKETGALVILLGPDETLSNLPEEEARKLWAKLHERFRSGQDTKPATPDA